MAQALERFSGCEGCGSVGEREMLERWSGRFELFAWHEHSRPFKTLHLMQQEDF